MHRIILVRHGQSIWNQDSKFTGWTNIPLTNHGRQEATQMAKTLIQHTIFPTVLFTSVLQRSIETSQLIQREFKQMPIYTSWRLNEKHYGTLEGVPRQHIRDVYGEPFTTMMRSNYTIKPPLITRHYKSIRFIKIVISRRFSMENPKKTYWIVCYLIMKMISCLPYRKIIHR